MGTLNAHRAAPRWTVPPALSVFQSDDGSWGAFDEDSRRSWSISAATAALVGAVRAGWQPGMPPPPPLEAAVGPAAPTDALQGVLNRLEAQGLAIREGGAAPRARAPQRWFDLRVKLLDVPPPPRWSRAGVLRVARFSPVLALVAVVSAARAMLGWAGQDLLAAWRDRMGEATGWELAGWLVVAAAALKLCHELGHAAVMGAATGRPVPIGVRLYFGLPQAYADAADVVTIPERRTRISVLLGGVTAEMLVWAALALVGGSRGWEVPTIILAAVLFGGPLSVLLNLGLPFFRNDGYFVLQELTGLRNLSARARSAAAAEFLRGEPEALTRWWLPWYGMLQVTYACALGALVGGSVARLVGWEAMGALAGVALVVTFQLRRHLGARAVPNPGR